EHPHARARRLMLRSNDRRPVPSGPAGASRTFIAIAQALIHPEPFRALPARSLEEHGPQITQPAVVWAGSQGARALHLLPGVDDVVHLDVLALGSRLHIGRAHLMGMEPIHVDLAQVDAGVPL